MSNKLSFLLRAKQLRTDSNKKLTIDEEIQQIINNNHPAGTLINLIKLAEKQSSSGNLDEKQSSSGNLAEKQSSSDTLINLIKNENIIFIDYEEDSDTETSDDTEKLDNLNYKILYKTNGEGLDYFSGPYEYKIYFENKEYPHSVNINKLIFKYKIGQTNYSKILYLSTGHSFAEPLYLTDQGIKIERVNQIEKIFEESDKNIFYSLDNGFNDFALINLGLTLNNTNKLKFNDKLYNVKSVCKNMDIKFLENETFIKNGNNIGETYARSLINFDTDRFIKNNDFYTFKINGTIVIIKTKFTSGIILKGINSNISKFNGLPITEEKKHEQLKYHFSNVIKELSKHEIFSNIIFDDKINLYYDNYKETNTLTIASLMGDSGSGFFRIIDNDNIEFVGINIGSCSMMILRQSDYLYPNKIMWNNSLNKLVFGNYIIEEVHKACQMLPIDKIKKLIKHSFNIDEITV